jgi:hypothetical protein
MKKTFRCAVGAAAIILSGCISPAERKAADAKHCEGYGFAQGTDGLSNCMMQTENRGADPMRQRQTDQQRKPEEHQKPRQAAPSVPAEPTAMDCTTSETTTTACNATDVQSFTSCRSR